MYSNKIGRKSFSFEHLFAFPKNIAQYDNNQPRKKVAIVGAGIAGLVAAYELKKLGHEVQIFEASNRIGGRIHTHFFSDGTYGELGAMRIPVNHQMVLHYIEQFGLKTRPFINHNENAYCYARGIKTRIGHWKRLLSAFNLPIHEQKSPIALYDQILQKAIDGLSDKEKWQIFASDFSNPLLKSFEEQTLWQVLHAHLSDEAIDYVSAATSMLHQKKASFLTIILDHFSVLHGDKVEIVGGMETLIQAFVKGLKNHIVCNAKIQKIQVEGNKTKLFWKQLGIINKQAVFDYAIVTVPLPALMKMDFQPSLPSRKLEAIRGVTYENASKMFFHVKKRPWEFDDHIYGGGSFSDLSFQQCWYPSDNVALSKNRQYVPSRNGYAVPEIAKVKLQVKDKERSHSPGVLLASYAWGDNALRFATLSESERVELILNELKLIHPTIEKYVEGTVSIAWDTQTNPGYGAHAFFGPGEHQRYQKVLTEPFPKEAPRVFFAGEHLGIIHGCIQGAIQTALAATKKVLNAPAPCVAASKSRYEESFK